jgi:hypothetical protein
VDETRELLDADTAAAITRLDAAEDRHEMRRALRELLATLHSWREHEARVAGMRHFWQAPDGVRIERLIIWRIVDAHYVSSLIDLERHELLSGPDLLPGPYVFTGNQAHFRRLADQEIQTLADERWREHYPHLSGRSVGTLARDAAEFLRTVNAGPSGSESVDSTL